MKLKRTRKERTCKACGAHIAKGDFYGQRSTTITGGNSDEDSLSDYAIENKAIVIERLVVRQDICQSCAEQH